MSQTKMTLRPITIEDGPLVFVEKLLRSEELYVRPVCDTLVRS